MSRRALLVGIDRYDRLPELHCSVKDATAMAEMLDRQDDGYRNYHCRALGSPGGSKLTRKHLMDQVRQLFANFDGAVLFYFSGHGYTSHDLGGFLVTEDGDWKDPGLAMRDLITLANSSKAWDVLLILDCCYAGELGDIPHTSEPHVQLRQGVTVLAASLPAQTAVEVDGHSLFTGLVLEGLKGGAADLRGRVSAASLYSYAEQGLGPWQQCPVYKSYVSRLPAIRRCRPVMEDDLLRRLPDLFENAWAKVPASQDLEDFDRLRQAGLLQTVGGKPLAAADLAQQMELTPLGRHYRYLAAQGLI